MAPSSLSWTDGVDSHGAQYDAAMTKAALGLVVLVAFWASGCSLPVLQKGDSCERSAECAEGLACVKSKCSSNLQSIADKSMAANLGLRDAAAADGASADAMAPPADAALSGNDGG